MQFVTDLALIPLLIFSLGFIWVSFPSKQRWRIDCKLIGEAFLSGLLLFYLIAMLSPSIKVLTTGWVVFPVVAAAGVVAFSQRKDIDGLKSPYLMITAGGVIVGWFAVSTCMTPISGHDARSIWTFHGKIIYYSDMILDRSNWTHPSIYFSHADYPKMFASLAAAISKSVGFWNEYLPKFAMILLNIPIIALAMGVSDSWLKVCLCLLLIWFFPGDKDQWGGYMDGMLASYAGLSSIFAARYIFRGKTFDIRLAILCAAMCTCLKNEGLLFAIISLSSASVFRFLANRSDHQIAEESVQPFRGAAAFVPAMLWLVWAKRQNLQNDLLSSGHWLSQFLLRVWNPDSWHALLAYLLNRFLVIQVLELMACVCLLLFLSRTHLSKRLRFASAHVIVVALIYYIALVLIYLGSYHDLIDHLDSSADRVLLLPLVQVMSLIIVVLDHYCDRHNFAYSPPSSISAS